MKRRSCVTVRIWRLMVSSERLDTLRGILSPDEQLRVGRMRGEGTAREFIASRGIARELLAHKCQCEPSDISFGAGKSGKPYLEHPALPLAFNLSHSGGHCALATGEVARVGVDIEALRSTIGDLAKSVFTPLEVAQYTAIQPNFRSRAFFRSWVAKEAYLKATGEGLAGGIKSLELEVTVGKEIRAISIRGDTTELSKWQFRGFDVSGSMFGAVAVETSDRTVELDLRFIDAEQRIGHAASGDMSPLPASPAHARD